MRLYVTDESFPELREVTSRWRRLIIWLRAFLSAARDWRLWALFASLVLVLVAMMLVGRSLAIAFRGSSLIWFARFFVIVGPALVFTVTLSTLGGELMRPHLRAVSVDCRSACPSCGHSLKPQIESDAPEIRCPECGNTTDRKPFSAPYRW